MTDNQRDMARKGRSAMPLGTKNVNAKFTDDQVRAIRSEARTTGITAEAIARRYGVHGSTIARMINRDSWPHITDEAADAVVDSAAQVSS